MNSKLILINFNIKTEQLEQSVGPFQEQVLHVVSQQLPSLATKLALLQDKQ